MNIGSEGRRTRDPADILFSLSLSHTHTHTHTHIYLYVYSMVLSQHKLRDLSPQTKYIDRAAAAGRRS